MSVSQSDIDALMAQATGTAEETPSVEAVESGDMAAPTPTVLESPLPRLGGSDVSRILGLTVPVHVCLAERDMALESILEITAGTIIEFEKSFDAELTLHVANHQIGTGFGVKIGENFGLRVSRIQPVENRIDAMGPRG